MKQKDIALIIVIVAISGIISFFAARMIFTTSKDRQVSAEVVDPIKGDFVQPDKKYFNSNSIDPTLPIQIGNDVNINPFSQQTQ